MLSIIAMIHGVSKYLLINDINNSKLFNLLFFISSITKIANIIVLLHNPVKEFGMKKILVLLLVFTCSALYGVCACQKPRPANAGNVQQVQAQGKKQCSSCSCSSKQQTIAPVTHQAK